MESIFDIQKRIKSVSNTQQITKAMEVVSATKMRKSQELALNAREYAFTAFELLANVSKFDKDKKGGVKMPELFLTNDSKKKLLLVVTSDKSLAGSLNSNVVKKAYKYYQDNPNLDLVVVGKKARDFFAHRGVTAKKVFIGHGDFVDFDQVKELVDYLKEGFLDKSYCGVVAVYTNFISTLKQEPVTRELLPLSEISLIEMVSGLSPERGRYADKRRVELGEDEYLFEPSRQEVLNQLVSRLFQMEIYHITLEANASEHSARMVAMKTASENAQDLVDDLTLEFNKRRQAKITQEIMEITSGSDAISNQ